jgi:uncharacterized protein YbbC (DUF1343 family)
MVMGRTRTGLEVITEDPKRLTGARVGLLTNYTGVTPSLDRNVEALRGADINLVALFGPEHGLTGSAQAGESEPSSVDEATGLPIVDTYAARGALDEAFAGHRLDAIVFDMQDVGVRYWTYTWSMYDAMVVAAGLGIRFVVLDRPNPLGGVRVEGPVLDRSFASFVGRTGTRQRHGLTSGELARLFNLSDIPRETGQPVDLEVVEMDGWHRDTPWEDTGLPWVMPSPNLPTLDAVLAFAATGLLEGTNASEGRGTTRPFELFGAPYVDARFVAGLRDLGLPGVTFRETWFRPTFHKHAREAVRGAQLYVTDRDAYRPVRTGLAIIGALARLYPDDFAVLPPRVDADADHAGRPLDRLWGSDALSHALESSGDVAALEDDVDQIAAGGYPDGVLLYRQR